MAKSTEYLLYFNKVMNVLESLNTKIPYEQITEIQNIMKECHHTALREVHAKETRIEMLMETYNKRQIQK